MGWGRRTWEAEDVLSGHVGDFRGEGSPFLVEGGAHMTVAVSVSPCYGLLFLSLGRLTDFISPPPIVLGQVAECPHGQPEDVQEVFRAQ